MEAELIVSMRNYGRSYDFDDAISYCDARPRLRLDGSFTCQMCNEHISNSSEVYTDIDDLLNRHVLDGLRVFSYLVEQKPYLHCLFYDGDLCSARLLEQSNPIKANMKVFDIRA